MCSNLNMFSQLNFIAKTCISGDLFDMLLPMLSIYQEYARNHHYSLQVPFYSRNFSAFIWDKHYLLTFLIITIYKYKYIDNGLWLTMWRELKLELLKVKVSKHENLTEIAFNIKHRKELTLGVFFWEYFGTNLI